MKKVRVENWTLPGFLDREGFFMTGFCGSEHAGHGPCSGIPENFSVCPHLRIAGKYCPVSNQNAVTILKTRFFSKTQICA